MATSTVTQRAALAVTVAVVLVLIGEAAAATWGGTPVAVDQLHAEREPAMTAAARILLVLCLSWIVIGMFAARTSLVRRPGAAAARATWIASTRPWRARESTLGMLPLDRLLLVLVPAALLLATEAVRTSLLAPFDAALMFVGWTVFVGAVIVLIGQRSPWPAIAAIGGVTALRCTVVLAWMSFDGPAAAAASAQSVRVTLLALFLALCGWTFVAAGWAIGASLGPRRATGVVVAAVGAGVGVPAAMFAVASGSLPAWGLAAGGVVTLVIGMLLALPARRVPASGPR